MVVDWDAQVVKLFTLFADENWQRTSWFGIGPDVSSVDEMCCWLEDFDVVGWVQKNECKIDRSLSNMICDFMSDIDKLPSGTSDYAAFASNEWMQLRLKASVIRDLLNSQQHGS